MEGIYIGNAGCKMDNARNKLVWGDCSLKKAKKPWQVYYAEYNQPQYINNVDKDEYTQDDGSESRQYVVWDLPETIEWNGPSSWKGKRWVPASIRGIIK